MAKRMRAHQLPHSTRLAIARFKENNDITYGKLAERFNCTYNQAWQAHKDYQSGKLKEWRTKPNRRRSDGDTDLSYQYERGLEKLAEADLSASEHWAILDKALSIRKTMQQVELMGHLKRIDSEIIARIIRRYEPHATDDRVVAIYKEEEALCQASL